MLRLPQNNGMFRIHWLVLLQVLLTPLSRSMFLLLFSSNNHNLHYRSFQMTVESNYVIAIAIAMLSDWLKRLAPVFQPMRIKTKTNRTMYAWFSRALSELQVIARKYDWFIALPAPVLIGRSNCFSFGFSTIIWKPLYHLKLQTPNDQLVGQQNMETKHLSLVKTRQNAIQPPLIWFSKPALFAACVVVAQPNRMQHW